MAKKFVKLSKGGAELNIAYGDTAPEDTSKLWVKTSKPIAVKVSSELKTVVTNSFVGEALGLAFRSWEGGWGQVGDKLWSFNTSPNAQAKDIIYFDIITKTVSTIPTQATSPRKAVTSAVVGNKIYLFGGYVSSISDKSNKITVFDTDTLECKDLEVTMPSAGQMMNSGASYGKFIYIFCPAITKDVYKFDTETETITTLPVQYPGKVEAPGFNPLTYGDNIYIFGGGFGSYSSRDIVKFDCITEKFTTTSATLPANPNQMTGAIYQERAFLFNGSSVYVFDFATETLEVMNTTLPNSAINRKVATSIDNVYLAGGSLGGSLYADIIKLSIGIAPSVAPNNLYIHNSDKNIFNLINTETAQVEIGVKAIYKGNADGIGEVVEASLHNGTSWVTI